MDIAVVGRDGGRALWFPEVGPYFPEWRGQVKVSQPVQGWMRLQKMESQMTPEAVGSPKQGWDEIFPELPLFWILKGSTVVSGS